MKTNAQYSDPSDLEVTITMRGRLREFEDLSKALLSKDSNVPYHQTHSLIDEIQEASRKLRGVVTAKGIPLEGDAP